MYTQLEKQKENGNRYVVQKKCCLKQGFGFVNNQPDAVLKRKFQKSDNGTNSSGVFQMMRIAMTRGEDPLDQENLFRYRKDDQYRLMSSRPARKDGTVYPSVKVWQKYNCTLAEAMPFLKNGQYIHFTPYSQENFGDVTSKPTYWFKVGDGINLGERVTSILNKIAPDAQSYVPSFAPATTLGAVLLLEEEKIRKPDTATSDVVDFVCDAGAKVHYVSILQNWLRSESAESAAEKDETVQLKSTLSYVNK